MRFYVQRLLGRLVGWQIGRVGVLFVLEFCVEEARPEHQTRPEQLVSLGSQSSYPELPTLH